MNKLLVLLFILGLTPAHACKERVDAVYQNVDGSHNIGKMISADRFFRGDTKNIASKLLKKAKETYLTELYFGSEDSPVFENVKVYRSVSTKQIQGYILQIGILSDEGSGVFTFDKKGKLLFAKSIDQSPVYRYICED